MGRKIYVLAILILLVGLAFTGCVDDNDVNDNDDNDVDDNDDNDVDNGYVGTGEEVFSGEWEGQDALGQDDYEGNLELTVDWENEDVSGWFDGDAEGDIDGSVSAGEITAEGEALGGYVTWDGTFSPDGSSVSGTWEIEADGITTYSGTWSGSIE